VDRTRIAGLGALARTFEESETEKSLKPVSHCNISTFYCPRLTKMAWLDHEIMELVVISWS